MTLLCTGTMLSCRPAATGPTVWARKHGARKSQVIRTTQGAGGSSRLKGEALPAECAKALRQNRAIETLAPLLCAGLPTISPLFSHITDWLIPVVLWPNSREGKAIQWGGRALESWLGPGSGVGGGCQHGRPHSPGGEPYARRPLSHRCRSPLTIFTSAAAWWGLPSGGWVEDQAEVLRAQGHLLAASDPPCLCLLQAAWPAAPSVWLQQMQRARFLNGSLSAPTPYPRPASLPQRLL